MALKAERPHIREVALAAAFGNGNDVIGLPQGFSDSGSPVSPYFCSGSASELPHVVVLGYAIESAGSADTTVALKHTIAQVARIGAQLPFFDTPFGAEGKSPRRNFESAPTAETAATISFRKSMAVYASAAHGALRFQVTMVEERL